METFDLTTRDLVAHLREQPSAAAETWQRFRKRAGDRNEAVGAFLSLADEAQPETAAEGVLAGVPVAVKDNICTAEQKTTCASKMLANFEAPYEATVVSRLKQAGAAIVGKVNLDEFAMGSSTENSALGTTNNPWKLKYVPGGSSGGSAAAVAAGMASVALGSDTGGSIRQPAAFCGVVGLKPTYGRVSRYGLVAFASSLDQIGPFSRDVYGSAATLQAIAGHDPLDSTSLDKPVPNYLETLDQPLEGLKLGFIEEWLGDGVDDSVRQAVQQAVDVYRKLGAEIVPVSLPHSQYGVATYYIIAPSEASSNLARYDGIHYGHRAENCETLAEVYRKSRSEGFGEEVKRRIMLGCYALSSGYYDAYYLKALKVRRLVQQDYFKAFADVDLLIGPVTPGPAFERGAMIDDPLEMYMADIFTIGANLAGIPAISLPAGMTDSGLPLGVQLLGPVLGEEKLLRAARMFELAQPWHEQLPPLQ
ncbi:Asp-tRNA(Asn)/Glu-tRNA(Gln) amidotransferase subunit GatA [Rubinisphaera brasiliensis]|uniref:Glutamyl-tRNA(Gln) amidotransferase subunit A n=1 Tax=Rubinisphaera brasiliensis (strain ATCC 49424 / DSM 5305 / JCM 21570 / IAM 15109 / NBRC 103401 / IFAM 1448) TaxID=756272 RepID=F0SP18_RUBBR|nr:Asp-tRNA(Asn)/Glu-tRNA(Gln) amidotransferase subunit GatA [Rubinisphaera brasiliensis]ADY61121.1 aspartyl/glutamyl-tRNA(Asn/Gln) amidotransferase subunit A [Rubinisphaera brasiliensis DSM 5305]